MNSELPKDKVPLKDSVIGRLAAENVTPRSRWFFRSRECVVWFLWLLSVLIGSLVVGVLLFLMTYRQYALYEATHDSFLSFLISTLPFLWIVTFLALVLTAIYNLRHTKRGYRYPLWTLMLTSVALSGVGGALLHVSGQGYALDRYLGEQLAAYTSEVKKEKQLWQQPEQGRLLGQSILETVAPTSTIVFEDSLGGRWRVEISDLSDEELLLLNSKELVRMFGQPINLSAKVFHACGVFPWLLHDAMPSKQLAHERQVFLDKSMSYIKEADRRTNDREMQLKLNRETDALPTETICAEMMPVKRVRERMQE